MNVREGISKGMVKFAQTLPKESIIEIKGIIEKSKEEINDCSQKTIEVQMSEIWSVNKSLPQLPFQIEDASRHVENQEDEY